MRIAPAIALAFVIVSAVSAQGPAQPAFEVASVRPTETAGIALLTFSPGGRLRVTNFALRSLVTRAWGLQGNQVDGGPAWSGTAGFDIEAKAEGDPSRDHMWLMLRTLLTDRFRLVTRVETRELPVYELVLARSDRKLGPNLRPASGECERSSPALGVIVVPDPGRPTCGALYSPKGHWTGHAITIDSLVRVAVREAGRVVLNKTGLEGAYDVDLQWTDLVALLRPDAPAMPADGPSFFGALQEQLGLKLEATKGLLDVLVIEHAEMPTPN